MADFQNFAELESVPSFIKVSRNNPRFLNKVLMKDSIVDPFPLAEIWIPDNKGDYSEANYFTEFLDFKLKMGSDDIGFINHEFYWDRANYADTLKGAYINGTQVMHLISSFQKQDSVKSRSFEDNISNVVESVIEGYKFPDKLGLNESGVPQIKISKTDNKDFWYQANQTDFDFMLDNLMPHALGKNSNKSPFFCFVNLLGEFNFRTFDEILNSEPVQAILSFSNDKETGVTASEILNYTISHYGAEESMIDYNKKVYKINKEGVYEFIQEKLDQHVINSHPNKLDKYTMRRQDLDTLRDAYSFGIVETSDEKNILGSINHSYRDTAIASQMNISLHYNPQLVAGRVIETVINSAFKERLIADEYSGKWVIIESSHLLNENGIPTTMLQIGRNATAVDKQHSFSTDFLG